MRFGNDLAKFRRVLIALLMVGLVLDIVLVVADVFLRSPTADWRTLLLPFTPIFFLALVAPTALFSIHIEGGRVKHMFLDRYAISDLPVVDFEDMLLTGNGVMQRSMAPHLGFTRADFGGTPGPWAATLYFKHGRKIRFFGAHMRIMRSLKDALISARQGHPVATT